MVVHSNVSRKLPEDKRHFVLDRVFTEMVEFAGKLKVKLALENLSYASSGYGKNVSELEEIFGIIDEKGFYGVYVGFLSC